MICCMGSFSFAGFVWKMMETNPCKKVKCVAKMSHVFVLPGRPWTMLQSGTIIPERRIFTPGWSWNLLYILILDNTCTFPKSVCRCSRARNFPYQTGFSLHAQERHLYGTCIGSSWFESIYVVALFFVKNLGYQWLSLMVRFQPLQPDQKSKLNQIKPTKHQKTKTK